MKAWPLIMVFFVSSLANAGSSVECDIDASVIAGNYKISTARDDRVASVSSLNIWRRNNEVAHQHPDRKITEIWNKLPNDRIRVVRYFDAHKQGIEYQADEIKGGQGLNEWSKKSQLIPQSFKQSMHLDKIEGYACDRLEYYTKNTRQQNISMVWSPSLSLPVEYKEIGQGKSVVIHLMKRITDKKRINNFFTLRENYQSTDYADIGDNESDPFLSNMINLGFIEHGASGFYNANGEVMAAEHAH